MAPWTSAAEYSYAAAGEHGATNCDKKGFITRAAFLMNFKNLMNMIIQFYFIDVRRTFISKDENGDDISGSYPISITRGVRN